MTHINQRRDTAANWASANPVLQLGEVGWERNTRKAKQGDGVTAWNSLPYSIEPVPNLALYATLASPIFSGNPTAPTPATADNDTSIATTAYVKANLTSYAPLSSPVLIGDPKAPTPATADNDTSIATTAYVKANLASYAPLVSPTFTGDPKAPTPATSDNDTSIATTAFVKAVVAAHGVWTAYTPVWSSSGTAPVLGNGMLIGAWCLRNKSYEFTIDLTFGSTTTPGTGFYQFSLPQAVTGSINGPLGNASLFDSGVITRPGFVLLYNGLGTLAYIIDKDGNTVGATVPHSFGNGDSIFIRGSARIP